MMRSTEAAEDIGVEWLRLLREFVSARPLVLVRLSDEDYIALLASRKTGKRDFTLRPGHPALPRIAGPCMCLITGMTHERHGKRGGLREETYVGVIMSSHVSQILELDRIEPVTPSISGLADEIRHAPSARRLQIRLEELETAGRLTPMLSVAIVDTLALTERNHEALRALAADFRIPVANVNVGHQKDAIDTSLQVFGLSADARAARLDIVKGGRSRLKGQRLREDLVIEHDARSVPHFGLAGSAATGRALFRNGRQTLEVITANRQRLEQAFGVDLIYINHLHGNVVMVQYKMLEPLGSMERDWIYTEDRHLNKQLAAMERFSNGAMARRGYRLSPDFFYFKFVRRYGLMDRSMLLPLEHFQELKQRGDSERVRISVEALDGHHMRPTAFHSLLQSGYIGTDISTTDALKTLIDDLLDGGDALVIATQREATPAEDAQERESRMESWDDEGRVG